MFCDCLTHFLTPPTQLGHSPLTYAVDADDPDAVTLLLKAGADPLFPNHANVTPMEWAEIANKRQALDVMRLHSPAAYARVSLHLVCEPPLTLPLEPPSLLTSSVTSQVRTLRTHASGKFLHPSDVLSGHRHTVTNHHAGALPPAPRPRRSV